MSVDNNSFLNSMLDLRHSVEKIVEVLTQQKQQAEAPSSIGKVFADADDNILEDEDDTTPAREVLQRLLSSLQQQHGFDLHTSTDVTRRYTPHGLQNYMAKYVHGGDDARQRALDALILVGLWDE